MRYLIVCVILILISPIANAQKSKYWGKLTPGKFVVGYQDTTLFNQGQHYALGDYSGPKPYFVKIWFPLATKSGRQIQYSDYLNFDSVEGIKSLTDSIQKVQQASFMSWGVTYNLDAWENEELTDAKQQLAKQMLRERLPVYKTSNFPKSSYPTIIYHHGNGGIPFENSVLFEFLASHGYVIISADYHWPNQREHSYTQRSDLALEDVDFIALISKTLTFADPSSLCYIGHSWGGGIALRLNQKKDVHFKSYIIFDSTLEKAGLLEMKAINPHLDSLLLKHPTDFKTKTTVITARASYYENGKLVVQPFPEFIPFQLVDKQLFTYITLKEILNHGSFTSVEVMRSVFGSTVVQKDVLTVNEQFKTYQFLVNLTKDVLTGTEPDKTKILVVDK